MNKKIVGYIWEKSTNIALALYYGYFAYIHLGSFIMTSRVSSLLIVVFEAIIIFCLLFRSLPKEVSISLYDWSVALLGTLMTMLLRPAAEVHDLLFLQALQLAGIMISCIGLLSLNKSYGTVPANRGIKTTGLYAHVRHPVYAGYFLSVTAFVLQNATISNICILALFILFSVLRMIAEEDFLKKDSAYAEYMKKIKWRVFPYVW